MPLPAPRDMSAEYDALHRQNVQLRRQLEHLSILREIGLAISASLELSETFQIIVNVVQGALDVKRVTIFEIDKDSGDLRPVIARYGSDLITRERLEEELISRRGTPHGDALAQRSVVLVQQPPKSAAYVPLLSKNEAAGLMLLEDPRDTLPFTQDDVALFQQLGSQIAIALHNAHLYAMAVTDGLTGLFVRRYFDLRMEEEMAKARRYQRPFSLLLFDIDHFKKFNDTHGHQTGDMVLRQFAKLLQKSTRSADICCRYGGEEMAVILPETALDEATLLANKLCVGVRNNAFEGTTGQELSVTTSIGVAEFIPTYETVQAMVEAVDAMLYQAKKLGRNRVEVAGL